MNGWSSFRMVTYLSAAALLAGGQVEQQQPQPQEDYVVRSDANLVVLETLVTTQKGSPVRGLDQSRFQVLENGRTQQIRQFSAAEAPVSIGLVVDVSGSMMNKVPDVVRAIRNLVRGSSPQDQFFVTGFNDKARLVTPFSSRVEDVEAAIQSFRMEGRTALYDGLRMSLENLQNAQHERRVLVLISDGRDNASELTREGLMKLVRESQATIHTIGLYFTAEADDRDGNFLRRLAYVSGGHFYHPANAADLEKSCGEIAQDIRARYTIAYVPGDPGNTAIRKIRVRVQRTPEDPRLLRVRTRSEYQIAGKATEPGDKRRN